MKTATVDELTKDVAAVLHWIEAGEEVAVMQGGTPVAIISPPPRRVKHPDYLARLKATFGDRMLSPRASGELRDLNRGEQ